MNMLVGCTGFVGSNLCREHVFEQKYHASDIKKAYGTKPELLVYAGVRAEKYLADASPEEDDQKIRQAFHNIERIQPQKLVLISTVDVYPEPYLVDETTKIHWHQEKGYGSNRYRLEEMVRDTYQNALIVRLPALYGIGLKKNFIYDYIKLIPQMLKADKYHELKGQSTIIKQCYVADKNGFYRFTNKENVEEELIKQELENVGFDACCFTDSRSKFQFYPLKLLWKHISLAMEQSITLLNLSTEPVGIRELYHFLEQKEFVNERKEKPLSYHMQSIYADRFGGKNGYVLDKNYVTADLKQFIAACKSGEIVL